MSPRPTGRSARLLASFVALSLAFAPVSVAWAADGAEPAHDAVQVRFRSETPEEKWALVTLQGATVCTFPCSHWISPGNDLVLERNLPGGLRVERIAIPADLTAPPGGTVDAVARAPRDHRHLGLGFQVLAASVLSLTLLGFIWTENRGSLAIDLNAGVGFGITGVSFALGTYLRAISHPSDVVLSAPSTASIARTRFILRPGFVEVEGRTGGGFQLVLSPFGASGTF